MRHHIHTVTKFDSGGNAYSARPFAYRMLFNQPVGEVFIHHFFLMISDVDERRFELHQRVDGIGRRAEILPFQRGQQLKRKQRTFGIGNMFYNSFFHIIFPFYFSKMLFGMIFFKNSIDTPLRRA